MNSFFFFIINIVTCCHNTPYLISGRFCGLRQHVFLLIAAEIPEPNSQRGQTSNYGTSNHCHKEIVPADFVDFEHKALNEKIHSSTRTQQRINRRLRG
ncbi:Uncharacterised protein [Klebsiella pneumoniae]|nr:Uncharacterised protein [Klebsiella pneumoniae]SYU11820.1 Uncharacterised protein [Klebsiella pneumoniae]